MAAPTKKLMKTAWKKILTSPVLGQHVAQVYRDDSFLEEAVSVFIGMGLSQGEGILLVATPAHLERFRERLAALGHSVDAAIARGQWTEIPSEEIRERVIVNGLPDPSAFKALVEEAIMR